jgi:hypothetical protein
MSKTAAFVFSALLLIALTAVAFFLSSLSSIGETLKDVNVTRGSVGEFVIGSEKQKLLSLPRVQFFATGSKACSTGWVDPSEATSKQIACLLSSPEWVASSVGTTAVCPKQSDVNTTLFFSGNLLKKVNVHCTRPE